jgi:hypothetical protein
MSNQKHLVTHQATQRMILFACAYMQRVGQLLEGVQQLEQAQGPRGVELRLPTSATVE